MGSISPSKRIDISGYEGFYQVDEQGDVHSVERSWFKSDTKQWRNIPYRILSPTTDRQGYLNVYLCKGGVSKRYRVHRLVALAFIPNPDKLSQVNHLDGDKSNPQRYNLEWTNNSGNQLHASKTGLTTHHKGRKAKKFCFTYFAISVDTDEIVAIMLGNEDMKNQGFDYRLISATIKGKRKSHNGCIFYRINHNTQEIIHED